MMPMAGKKLLFVIRKTPHGPGCAAEMLDAVLVAAAFGQEVHVAFIDDGVFQLVDRQHPEAVGRRGVAEAMAELADCDVDQIWAEEESLAERGLSATDLLMGVTLVERAALAELMATMEVAISA
jgi:tRNA 2-thiouridine synthesizing protein C